jgi:hypothetical protein
VRRRLRRPPAQRANWRRRIRDAEILIRAAGTLPSDLAIAQSHEQRRMLNMRTGCSGLARARDSRRRKEAAGDDGSAPVLGCWPAALPSAYLHVKR